MGRSKPTLISFCSGYGGLELGIESALGRKCFVLSYAEIEAPAVENLVAKMEAGSLPPAPIWTDLKTFPSRQFHGMVDILCGGYPCQPFSAAGKRLGAEDPRHLWPYIRMHIARMRPAVCFFENVDGHISMGLMEVLADLRALGYRVENDRQEPTWGVFSAAEVGAPHQRKRVFILARREDLADDQRQRIEELGKWLPSEPEHTTVRDGGASSWPSRPGQPQWGWEPPRVTNQEAQSPLGRDAHGSTPRLDLAELSGLSHEELAEIYRWMEQTDNRVDELRLLGNGCVPEQVAKAWTVLFGRLLYV